MNEMSASDLFSHDDLLWEQYVLDKSEVKRVVRTLEHDLVRTNDNFTRQAARKVAIELAVVVQFEYNGRARPKFVDEKPPEYLLVKEAIERISAQMEAGVVALTASNQLTMAAGILICLLAARGDT